MVLTRDPVSTKICLHLSEPAAAGEVAGAVGRASIQYKNKSSALSLQSTLISIEGLDIRNPSLYLLLQHGRLPVGALERFLRLAFLTRRLRGIKHV